MDQKIPAIMEQGASNVPDVGPRTIVLKPNLLGREREFRQFCRFLDNLITSTPVAERHARIEKARDEVQGTSNVTASKDQVALNFARSVVLDMVAQGWVLSFGRGVVELTAPKTAGVTPDELKQRIREGHLLERDAQLRQPTVREFIKEMETKRLGPAGWVSIFSLMRDGRDLVQKLRASTVPAEPSEQRELRRGAVAPYLQVAESGVKCQFTGLLLYDIWRYFRHTWVSTYKSLPGRSMMILVRDAAAPCHPVIGIAALGSSMAQQTQRDQWIGWDSEKFLEELTSTPSAEMAQWTHDAIDRLVRAIYVKDLIKSKILKSEELRAPTQKTIERLLRFAEKSAGNHLLNPDAAKHKSSGGTINWEWQAQTALFRSKRAKALARLLGIRTALPFDGRRAKPAEQLKMWLATTSGRTAMRQLVRLVKAEHVGVDMMDIIICGAVAPYNAILGGKLVCLLLTSPEVVKFYRRRYEEQESIIASSMKGRAVVRPPNLVLLATTSLYGVGSSQYNRVRVPLAEVGGKAGEKLEYLELGVSRGYGTYQFSQATIDYLETLLGRAGDGRKVNSIFGEGVNPLMRKIREGLCEIGFPSDDLLNHGNARVVYGIPLAENFREVLLGLTDRPRYYLPLQKSEESTEQLAEFWRKRWLAGRITRPGILEAVEKHTLSYPITHGARVALPKDGQAEFFDDSQYASVAPTRE